MVWIPGGEFQMGSDQHYVEEHPAHRVRVDGFWMDRSPVTNARFAEFVRATGYVTFAEIPPSAAAYPDALPEMLYAGSLVFDPPIAINLNSPNWWQFRRGANWQHPIGPGSSSVTANEHPVVHIAYADAEAFAAWEGKSIPSEAEWEFAARGGLDGADYAWGNELTPNGRHMANTWQGEFPLYNSLDDGYFRTSPVGAFPSNGYGLYDMIGNVWEWTSDWYAPRHLFDAERRTGIHANPRQERPDFSYDPTEIGTQVPRKVLKGGSYLCAPNYSRRYRPAARFPEPIDTSACDVGFRCVVRGAAEL
jgi:formylglycine-generating enzyme